MSTQIQTRPVTADELLRMPGGPFRRELVRGELKQMALAEAEHGRVTAETGMRLAGHVAFNRLGVVYAAGTGFQIASDPDTVRAPDAAFVRKERAAEMRRVQGYLPGAPDLAVEVISPGDTYSEVVEKAFDWLDAGSRLVVVVDPRRRNVTLYRSRDEIRVLGEGDVLDGADVVPGWRVPVSELFG